MTRKLLRELVKQIEGNGAAIQAAAINASHAASQAGSAIAQSAAQQGSLNQLEARLGPPTGLTLVSNSGFFTPDGSAYGRITLTWDAMEEAVEYEVWSKTGTDDPIRLTSTRTPNVTLELLPEVELDITVRAKSVSGQWGEDSAPLTVTPTAPLPVLTAPTQPILASELGGVSITWNGLLTSGAPGLGFSHVQAYRSPNGTSGWVRVGPPFKAGTSDIDVTPGQTYHYRLVAVNTLGVESNPSTSAPITVVGVTVGDIPSAITDAITEANDTADAALVAANGKNKNYYQTTQPTGGTYLAGDLWFDTDDNYKMYTYTGSAWQVTQDSAGALTAANGKNKVWHQAAQPGTTGNTVGDTWFDSDDANKMYEWSGSAWVPNEFGSNAIANLAITNAKIADGTIQNAKILDGTILNAKIADATIQSAKIAALDAGKITTGLLSADRIGANTLGVSKLLVTSMANLAQDPSFEYNTGGAWSLTGGASSATTSPRTGARALSAPSAASDYVPATQADAISVSEGDVYRLGGWVRLASGTSAGNGVTLRMVHGSTEAATPTASADVALTPAATGTTYVYITGTWTVPAGARYARMQVVMRDSVAGKTYLVDDLELFKMNSGSLIVDGAVTAEKVASNAITTPKLDAQAVTAEKIAAFTIEANNLSPSVGSSLDISANGSVNILVGQVNAQADSLAAQQGQIEGLGTAVSEVAGVANGAASAAESAQSTADGAATTADATAATVGAMGQVYRFSPTGAEISSPDSPYMFIISNTGAQIKYNNVTVSEWNAGQMKVDNFVGVSVLLGNHKLEKLGTRTIMRKAV